MREELAAQLREKYPDMFPPRDDTGSGFLFECGDGWHDLIDALCWTIEQEVKNRDGSVAPVQAIQVKEKFAGLRFYYSGGNSFIEGAVRMANVTSYCICDQCGNSGSHMKDTKDIEMTRCEVHAPKKRKYTR
ncbi:hypothetical protein GCM10027046_23070 [Uliginosibacterium flavum]|uniref:Uncharacterized protein n=1 Tax=Uliginosibacterium flavum TaxID=1396831 RepID=A0ABV2TLI2_9RHOO